MIVPVLRHVAERLEHPLTGVNALLAAVPRDVDDAAPADVAVCTAADHPVFALGPIDESLRSAGPLVLVTHAGRQPTAGPGGVRLTGRHAITVALRYVAEESPTFAFDAYQVLAACERALLAPLVLGSMEEQEAVRNGVRISAPTEPPALLEPPPDAMPSAFVPALLITYPVLSPWTYGGG